MTILVPLLFAILEFGAVLERLIAQDTVAVQAARYAGEIGGDGGELRAFVAEQLRRSGLDATRVTVEVVPSRVGWREPLRVTLTSDRRVAIPFLFATDLPLRSSALARGEVNR